MIENATDVFKGLFFSVCLLVNWLNSQQFSIPFFFVLWLHLFSTLRIILHTFTNAVLPTTLFHGFPQGTWGWYPPCQCAVSSLFLYSYSVDLLEHKEDIGSIVRRAASIPKGNGQDYLQMKLVYSKLAPIFLFFFQWMDYSCSCLPSSHFNLFRVLVYKVCVSLPLFFFFYAEFMASFFDFLIYISVFRCTLMENQICIQVEGKQP